MADTGRITEAELRELELAAEYESRNFTRPLDWTAESLRLVAELRRLRGLIRAAAYDWRRSYSATEEAAALIEEARIIREEQT